MIFSLIVNDNYTIRTLKFGNRSDFLIFKYQLIEKINVKSRHFRIDSKLMLHRFLMVLYK
jgi:hypothetical protein